MTSTPPHPARRPTVVTGASTGIGAATAATLAGAGYPVALGARRVELCAELADRLRAQGGEAIAYPLDLTDPDSVTAFATHVSAELGPIEVVISNAGAAAPGVIHEVDPDRFGREVDLNLLGAHRLVSALVPGMVSRRRGDVVFVSSDVVARPRPFMAAYAATKWGLEGMAHAMQLELEGTGVRASIVRPGPTWSELAADWDPDDGATLINHWVRFGLARHSQFLAASAVADAIAHVVSIPRGVHLHLIEISPEAPVVLPEVSQEER